MYVGVGENGVLALIFEQALRELLVDRRTIEVWPGDLDRIPLRRLALLDKHSQTIECAKILKSNLPFRQLRVGHRARRHHGKMKGRCCICCTRTRNRVDSLLSRWNRYHMRTGLLARYETKRRSPVSRGGGGHSKLSGKCTEPGTKTTNQ